MCLAPSIKRAVSLLWFFFHSNNLSYIFLFILHVFKIIALVKIHFFLDSKDKPYLQAWEECVQNRLWGIGLSEIFTIFARYENSYLLK